VCKLTKTGGKEIPFAVDGIDAARRTRLDLDDHSCLNAQAPGATRPGKTSRALARVKVGSIMARFPGLTLYPGRMMMDQFTRFGIYVVPEGAFYRIGAAWLGWDCVARQKVTRPDWPELPGEDALVTAPRQYGFHGTIKPPFRLLNGTRPEQLAEAVAAFCGQQGPVSLPKLEVRRYGKVIAIVPTTPSAALVRLAADTVRSLDRFRAPANMVDLARRRKVGLTDWQEGYLRDWGFPYVMEEFRFHLTLTGPLGDKADAVARGLAARFRAHLPAPFIIDSLCLMGEGADRRFHMIHRYPLSGLRHTQDCGDAGL